MVMEREEIELQVLNLCAVSFGLAGLSSGAPAVGPGPDEAAHQHGEVGLGPDEATHSGVRTR